MPEEEIIVGDKDKTNVAVITADTNSFVPKGACAYEKKWTADVTQTYICKVHNERSKYTDTFGPNRPCLMVEPYTEAEMEWLEQGLSR